MIRWRKGEVVRIRREWPGAVELDVTVPEGECKALAYPPLVGRPQPGDEVLLNTTALAMGLGTGGYAMVVAVPNRLPEDPSGPHDEPPPPTDATPDTHGAHTPPRRGHLRVIK